MAPENRKDPASTAPSRANARSDRSPWNPLLLVPVTVPLLTFLYNDEKPVLVGFPAFYWMQLSFILLGVACTVVVYRATRKRG